ncbi:MAG TPA: ABC transporter family substrate-binding protein [Candidatus Acidoferrales bacterium]
MKRKIFLITMTAAALVLLGTLAGCGSSTEKTGTAAGEKSNPVAEENQMYAQPRDKVKQGGKMIWAIDSVIVNFNINQLDGTAAVGNWVISAMMPQTFVFDARATPKYDPDYLMGEPELTPGPPQVVKYKLNPKAVWSDGSPITAADFIAQWKALSGKDPAFHISASNGYDHIKSVTQGANQFEAIVTFSKPYSDWKGLFSPVYPASTNTHPEIFNTGWKNNMLTSGGPFRLASYDATAKTYTLVPNEKWWGNKPKLDQIIFRVIDDDAEPSAMANGEIDLMDVGPSADEYNRVKSVPGVDIRVAGGPNFRHITFNGSSPMLKDVNVRQAIAMAIDRTAIAKAELGQLPVKPVALNNHIFMENQNGYQDNSAVIAYNPVKAKQMLDAAGWTVQGNKRVKNGQTLAINLVIPGGVSVSRSESELIQNMLAQVNVAVSINTVPSDNFFDKYITPGQFDMTVFAWLGTPFPVSASQSIYRKPVDDKIQQNFARIGSEELDHVLDQAVQELDPQKAIALANQADTLIWQEVHSLTDYQRPDIWAVKKGLANMGAYGFASIAYEDIGWVESSSGK